jgi:hypothetical protein
MHTICICTLLVIQLVIAVDINVILLSESGVSNYNAAVNYALARIANESILPPGYQIK